MKPFQTETLSQLLWDMDQTQERINAVSKYMCSYPEKASTIYNMWEERLYDCYGERKILFLYVLNDVIQVYRRSELALQMIDRLDTVLYAVARDVPSLIQKISRLIKVWRDRRVISDSILDVLDKTVMEAQDDYYHHFDRRDVKEQNINYDNIKSYTNEGFSEDESVGSLNNNDDSISSNIDTSADDNSFSIEKDETITNTSDLQEALDCLLLEIVDLKNKQKVLNSYQGDVYSLPDWVLDPRIFNDLLPDLLNDTENSSEILYNAMSTIVDLQKQVVTVSEQRKRVRDVANVISGLKRKHVMMLEKEINECDNVKNQVEKLSKGEDVICHTMYKPREHVVSLVQQVSPDALQTISKTLQQAEEERKKEAKKEEERKKKQSELRDIVNKSLMKSSAEDFIGKSWNMPSLYDRTM